MQLFPGRRQSLAVNTGYVKIEVAHLPDFIGSFTRMAGIQINPAALLMEAEYSGRADNRRRAAAIGGAVQFTTVHKLAARPFLYPPAGAGDVADIGGKAAFFVHHDEDRPFGERVDVRI